MPPLRDDAGKPRAGLRAGLHRPGGDPGYAALKAQVIARTGHHYYEDKDDLLFDRLRRCFEAAGLRDCTAYRALLDQPDAGPAEWAVLEAEITIGETFFFRYAEQFEALRTTILPGLVAQRAAERNLTIWSAGCSTGAEPYSIAILLHELLGAALPDWSVSIVGTDISDAALATARAARYGRWALRTTPVAERLRYFLPGPAAAGPAREGSYALRPEFARMVRFERGNLMGLVDGTLPPRFAGFDLILCRNVLIYFSADVVLGILRGLSRRLDREGWLLIGHAEPNAAFESFLRPVNLPGTVAYRLPGSTPAIPARPAAPVPRFAPPPDIEAPPPPAGLGPAPRPEAPAPAPPEPESDRPAALARIRALADAGETAEAWRALREALDAAPTDPALHYYEGLLAGTLGREAEAERAFRRALYLDRAFVMAHYQLGLLLVALGRRKEAARVLDTTIRLCRGLGPDAEVAEGDGVAAQRVMASAELARAGLGSPA